MDTPRNKTQKRPTYVSATPRPTSTEQLQLLLEEGAKDAYSRQWHRIERGLRLNRLRLFIEDVSPNYAMNKEEKDHLFLFLQKALDKKLLNTLKVVHYDSIAQRILSIKGLDMKRHPETNELVYELQAKKIRVDTTRKRKKEEVPSVSVTPAPAPAPALLPESKDEPDPEPESKPESKDKIEENAS